MINVAILGFGFMGKKHFEVLKNLPNFKLCAIIDHQINHINPDLEYFQSLDLFLEQKPKINLVVISTPNFNHYSSAKKLLENGYSVLIEKPFCLTFQEAESLNHTAKNFNQNFIW